MSLATLAGLGLGLLLGAAPAPDPVAALRAANARVRAAATARERRADADLALVVREALDLPRLARAALGAHWEARTEAERRRFTTLFGTLIERRYVRTLQRYAPEDVTFQPARVRGREAEVAARVTWRVQGGRVEEAALRYRLHRSPGGWRVTDLDVDGASLVRAYRRAFHRVLAREGFDALCDRLAERLRRPQRRTP